MNDLKSLFIWAMLLCCCSCATLRGSKQRVKIASVPNGAEVLFEGAVLGKTPCFVEVPRKKMAALSLKLSDGSTLQQPLRGSYRWGDSFFSNLIWVVWGAPVGWGIDLLSGSAWEYEKVPLLHSYLASSHEIQSTPLGSRTISIAPPQQSYELLSDELGEKIEKIAKNRFFADEVLPFKTTQPVFNSFSYDHSKVVREIYREKLYYQLKTSHVLETTTERTEKGVQAHLQLVDVFSDQPVHTFSELIPPEELKSTQRGSFFETASSLIAILPNTGFFDLTDSTLRFIPTGSSMIDPYRPLSIKERSAWTYLTSFAFRNSRSPKLDELKGVFRLIPDLNFYYDQFYMNRDTSPNRLKGLNFSWYSLAAGFGPELGLESPIGYFYLDIIPSLAIHWLSSEIDGSTLGSFELNAELGYSIFLSQRIVLRLFGRAITGPADQWSSLLSHITGEDIRFLGVAHGIYGLSIGYYFPEGRSLVKNAFWSSP